MKASRQIKIYAVLISIFIGVFVLYNKYKNNFGREENRSIVSAAKQKIVSLPTEKKPLILSYEHPYLKKPDSLNQESLYDSALFYYKEAAFRFLKDRNWMGYVWANINAGNLYISVSDLNYKYDEAVFYLNSALTQSELHLGKNHPFTGTLYYLLGKYYFNKSNSEIALKMLNRSLRIRIQYFGKNSPYVARVYDTIGEVYTYIGFDNLAAEKYLLQSLAIKEEIGKDGDGRFHENIHQSFYSLIAVNNLKGDYEKALSYCFLALSNADHLTDRKEIIVEEIYAAIAEIYINQEKYDEAIKKLNEAILINLAQKNDQSSLQYYYNSLGYAYNKKGAYKKSEKEYVKALNIFVSEKTSNVDFMKSQASNTFQGLGIANLNQNKLKKSKLYFDKCLAYRLKFYGKKHTETAQAYQNISNYYEKTGQLDSAFNNCHQSMISGIHSFDSSNKLQVPSVRQINKTLLYIPQLISTKASLLKRMYLKDTSNKELLKSAFSHYCLADTLLTQYRRSYDRQTSKLAFTKVNQNMYEEALECAFMLNQRTGGRQYENFVFHFIDKQKSSLLYEEMYQNDANKKEGNQQVEIKENLLKRNYYYLQSKLEEENISENPNEINLRALHSQIQNHEKQLDSIKRSSVTINQKYLNSYNQDSTGLSNIKSLSTIRHTLILEYFWGYNAVYILGINKDKHIFLKVNKSENLDNAIKSYRNCLMKGYNIATKSKDFAAFKESAHLIYAQLVKPVFDELISQTPQKNPEKKIIIIPDGPLLFIPFESLITSSHDYKSEVNYAALPYLMKDFTISYNYSTQFILNNSSVKKEGRMNLLAFSFSKDDKMPNKKGELREVKNELSELPGSAKELVSISSFLDGKYFMGDEATEEQFKKEAPDFDIIHLALHGQSDSASVYKSRLLFKKSRKMSDDGSLYNYELMDMDLRSKLAVLSACESGVGKFNEGEGVYSIARGFTSAGCPSILMTLWKVNDQSTANLMEKFYKFLSTGDDINASIQKAKLDFINQSDARTSHPANWASFLLMGNTDAIMKANDNNYLYYSVGLLLLFIVIALAFFVNSKYKKRGKSVL